MDNPPQDRPLNPVVARVLERARTRMAAELDGHMDAAKDYEGEVVVVDGKSFVVLTNVYIHRVSKKAIQITFDGAIYWVPKSLIHESAQFSRWQEDCRMMVAEWFAKKSKLI